MKLSTNSQKVLLNLLSSLSSDKKEFNKWYSGLTSLLSVLVKIFVKVPFLGSILNFTLVPLLNKFVRPTLLQFYLEISSKQDNKKVDKVIKDFKEAKSESDLLVVLNNIPRV